MITIALDEYGKFEKGQSTQKPIFIAGILYDNKGNNSDTKDERKRIEEYFKKVCESAGTNYPVDLHYSRYVDNKVQEALTKKQIDKTLSEYLQYGTYEGKSLLIDGKETERKGQYYIFVLLKSKKGKEELRVNNVSMIVNEKIASNLYMHMAEEVVSRLIFHNPIFGAVKHIELNLPTRLGAVEDGNIAEKKKHYEDLGFKESSNSKDNELLFNLMNIDVYRTAIEREMIERDREDIKVEPIHVDSISYNKPSKRLSFLRLSDSVCSVLADQLQGNQPKDWIVQMDNCARKLTGSSNNILFAYDSIDTYFRKAWMKVEDGEYFDALSLVFDAVHMGSEMTDYYKMVWVPLFMKKLQNSAEESEYVLALRKTKSMIMKNGLNQEKLVFIYKKLEELANVLKKDFNQRVFYDLYDVGVTAYTHIGNSKKAEAYFDKCTEYAVFVEVERYLASCNKMVVFQCDLFAFEKAVQLATDHVTYMEMIGDIRSMIFPETKYFTGLAKAYSQLGQVYAYMRDEKAEECFMKALSGLEKASPDYNISLSYLLHYYIDMGEEEKYAVWAKEYFGGEQKLDNQFNYLIREGAKEDAVISLKFALYVFIKAIYTFYMDTAGKKLFNKLLDLETIMKTLDKLSLKQLNGHPWELIYKYVAFIALDNDKKEYADMCIKKAEQCLEDKGFTIDQIVKFGNYQYMKKCEEFEITEEFERLENIITYMYR